MALQEYIYIYTYIYVVEDVKFRSWEMNSPVVSSFKWHRNRYYYWDMSLLQDLNQLERSFHERFATIGWNDCDSVKRIRICNQIGGVWIYVQHVNLRDARRFTSST